MKTSKYFFPVLLLSATVVASCKPPEPEENFEFKVITSEGTAVSGVQTVNFDGTLILSFSAKSVASVDASAPAGWSASVSMSSRQITVKAPAATDATAAETGALELTAKSNAGKTITERVELKVTDAAVSYSVVGLPDILTFVYGETKILSTEASNVAKVEAEAPAGWKVSPDLSARTVSITAPGRDQAGAATEGSVSLKPFSARGNAGSPVKVNVGINAKAPTIIFSPTSLSHVAFGSENIITASEVTNVANIELLDAPKGWTFIPDIESSRVKLIAPAADAADYDGEGSFVVRAISETGDTHEYRLPVSVKGINNKEEFIALANAYNSLADGADPSSLFADYVWNGEVVLNADLDLSSAGAANFISREFVYTFNGKGHTVTLDYSGDADAIGFFYCVSAPGKVCNINFAGNITSTHYVVKLAVVSCISKGGTFENINTSVSITQTGQNGAENESSADGFLGSICADEQGSGHYIKCRNTGAIAYSNVKYMGGLIGDIWDNTSGTVSECSNTAPIIGNFKSYVMNDAIAGGVIGNTIGSNWTYSDSYNSGSFRYNFNKLGTGIRALGGFAGTIFGHYERCYNTGDVINTDGLDANFATRRIGGFGGGAWRSNDCVFFGKDCYNTGNVSDICNYIGGFVGILEDTDDIVYHIVENCYNKGNVTVLCNNAVSDAFGGFAGTLYNVSLIKNCRNEGKVIGVSRRCAGGFVGRAADYVHIQDCSNSGEVLVGAVEVALSKPFSPVVGGICGIAGDGAKVVITNSKNTGKITAMTVYQQGLQSAYAAESALAKIHDPASTVVDQNSADEASIKACAGATLVWIPKNEWSENTIRSWIK